MPSVLHRGPAREGAPLIRLHDIQLRFGERVVLDSLDWNIPDRSRVALVGPNGTGKTTLLRILAGQAEPDDGSVELPPEAVVGYLPQDLVELGEDTVVEYLKARSGIAEVEARLGELEHRIAACTSEDPELRGLTLEHDRLHGRLHYGDGYAFDAEARKVLVGLGFRDGDGDRPCSAFSGGWKMRILLAALLLARPDVLLLDEPTNHLDTESMEWLEGYLRDFSGTLVVVSHDRRFLDRTAGSIAELARGKIVPYSYGYEAYLRARETRAAQLEKERQSRQEEIARVSAFVERFRYKASKASQVQSRIKMLERLEIDPEQEQARSVHIRFPEAPRCAYEVLRGEDLAKRYGDHLVFRDVSVTLHRGEKVALVGINGAGKSTLLRLLSQGEDPTEGTVELGSGVRKGTFSQESAQNLRYAHTVWEEVCSTGSKLNEQERRNLLGAFLFSGEDIHKPAGVLSGGEKSRLALLKLLLSDTNLLILDEPTNHLDQNTKDLFQRALLQYSGTILLVSHDRYFLDDLAERVLEIRDGRLYDYPGNYSYFLEKRAAQLAEEAGQPHPEAAQPRGDAREAKRVEAEERNRLYRLRKAVQDRLDPVERAIGEEEARKTQVEALLCDPQVLADSPRVQDLMKELKSLQESLKTRYEEWEALSLEMEAID